MKILRKSLPCCYFHIMYGKITTKLLIWLFVVFFLHFHIDYIKKATKQLFYCSLFVVLLSSYRLYKNSSKTIDCIVCCPFCCYFHINYMKIPTKPLTLFVLLLFSYNRYENNNKTIDSHKAIIGFVAIFI